MKENGNGFGFNGNGRGDGSADGGSDSFYENDEDFEEEDEHEHEYIDIVQSSIISAYEEVVHQVITLEFHERGLTLDFTYEELGQLSQAISEVAAYIGRKGNLGT